MTTTTGALVDNDNYLSLRPSIGAQVSTHSRHKSMTNAKQHKNNILKELPISESDLTEEDIRLYAKQIGIDPSSESHLLWIAKKGLTSRLPFPWIAVEDQRGRLYYFNCQTDKSCWEHPCDPYYRSLAEQQRLKGSSTTLSMSGLTSIANLHFVDEDLGFKSDANGSHNQLNKKSPQIEDKTNTKVRNESLKYNNKSEEEVESVEFELEVSEALEEVNSDDDLKTIDVTEGGINDVKQYKEMHSIQLNENVVNSESKYREVDESLHKSKANESMANRRERQMRDKMQNISIGSSAPDKHIHAAHIKQSTGNSTGSTNQTNIVGHNEVSSVDEFLLDVSEDPFAEFDGYELNYNDLFGSLGTGSGTGMSSKYDNSGNYEQTSDKQMANNGNKSHKPLETLLETSEKEESVVANSAPGADEEDDDDDNQSDDNIYELNEQQIEYRFEEMTNSLTEKITALRNELREEIKRHKIVINKEVKSDVSELSANVDRHTSALSETKAQIQELRQIIDNKLSQTHTSAIVSPTVSGKAVESNFFANEMQLLRSDVRSESMEAIRELRVELNREIKTRVNSVCDDLQIKLDDFNDDRNREMKAMRTEMSNVSNNSRNFGQQTNDLKNDFSEAVADIERHRKEYTKRFERMDNSLSEETQRFQSEVERLQTLMKRIENRVQELENESNEIRLSSRLDQNELKSSECKARVDEIDRQVRDLAQQLLAAIKSADNQKDSDVHSDQHMESVVNEHKHIDSDVCVGEQPIQQTTGAANDETQPQNIHKRMSSMEENIKRICDSFQQMNRNVNKNRNVFNKKNVMNNSRKSVVKDRHQSEGDYDYTSRSSTSLLSSSSISEPRISRPERKGRHRQEWLYKRSVHHSLPHRSGSHKTDFPLAHKCCIHSVGDYSLPQMNYKTIKVPLMPSAPQWQHQESSLRHIRTSSSSLLNLIKKTTKKLREEAIELESIGNYRFVSECEPTLAMDVNGVDNDETAIKRLKSVRLDVDQKLRRLSNILNQQKSSQI